MNGELAPHEHDELPPLTDSEEMLWQRVARLLTSAIASSSHLASSAAETLVAELQDASFPEARVFILTQLAAGLLRTAVADHGCDEAALLRHLVGEAVNGRTH